MLFNKQDDEFSFEAFSLDATVFEVHGRWYYVWAEKVGVGKQISNLYIAEMENGYTLKTVQVLLTTPDYDWERVGFWAMRDRVTIPLRRMRTEMILWFIMPGKRP